MSNRSHYNSLYRGEVVNIDDPLKIGRCQILVTSVFGDLGPENYHRLPWARPLAPYPINKKKGSVVLPEIGDILWVLFEGGVREFPIYIGGTYGQGETPLEKDKIVIYIEDNNRIVYDRKKKSYLFNIGENGILLDSKGINIVGNVKINGNIEVAGSMILSGVVTPEASVPHEDIILDEISPSNSTEGETSSPATIEKETSDKFQVVVGGSGGSNSSGSTTHKTLIVTGGVGMNRFSDTESFCDSLVTTISVLCRDENGNDYDKRLTVNKYLADDIKSIFNDIYTNTDFCIRKDDTGAYNYRKIKGYNKLSYHSYGVAIDINWNLNPYLANVSGSDDNLRLRTTEHPVVKIFRNYGWGWGGTYEDHMHFSYFDGH